MLCPNHSWYHTNVLWLLNDLPVPDIDECNATNLHICDRWADCTNTIGSFVCTCKVGYRENGTSGCRKGVANTMCPHLVTAYMSPLSHPSPLSSSLSLSTTTDCTNGDLRLVNGTTVMSGAQEGRVEMCYNNTYGTICDDRWTPYDAVVVCNKLGIASNTTCEYLMSKIRGLFVFSMSSSIP